MGKDAKGSETTAGKPSGVDVVYRLLSRSDWARAQAQGDVPYGALDRRDGYLHLSDKSQLLETAGRYFAGRDDMLALEIPCAAIADALRFEPVEERGGMMFPHLYASLPINAVTRIIALREIAPGVFVLLQDAS